MKPFTTFAFVILVLAGLMQALRAVLGFDVIIAGHEIPRWGSVIAALIALVVAYKLREETRG